MRIYKATYRDRVTPEQKAAGIKGEKRETSRYYVEFRDHRGCVRRLAAYKNRDQSVKLGEMVDAMADRVQTVGETSREQNDWLSRQPSSLKRRLAKIGLIEMRLTEKGKSLVDHAKDFKNEMIAEDKTEKHAEEQFSKIKKVIAGIKAQRFSQIDSSSVMAFLKSKRDSTVNESGEEVPGLSKRTSNSYLVAIKSFVHWAIEKGFTAENKIAQIEMLNAETDKRHSRRVLEEEEINRLLVTTESSRDRWGMSGQERAMVYRVAVMVGLRANEIRTLKKNMFDLAADPPTLKVTAKNAKNRQTDYVTLPPELVTLLKPRLDELGATDLVFRMTSSSMAKPLQRDLEAAGIPYVIDGAEGPEFADFHALRTTMCSRSVIVGNSLKVTQLMARHKNINTTAKYYAKLGLKDRLKAQNMMPNYTPKNTNESLKATGTDGKAVLASVSPQSTVDGGTFRDANESHPPTLPMHSHRSEQQENKLNPNNSKQSKAVESVGIEPTTCGLKVSGPNTEKAEGNEVSADVLARCLAKIREIAPQLTNDERLAVLADMAQALGLEAPS